MKKILFIILVLSGLLLPAQTNNIETGTTFYVSEGTSVYFSGVAIDGLLSVQAVNAETEIVIDGEITGDANFELNGNKVNLTLNAGTWNVLNVADENVNNLLLQTTGVAEIPSAHSLTILGDFNNTNATVGVKLLADASGYGQILTSGTVTNAGTTYAEQYLTSQTNAGWRQLASPVSTTLAEVDDDFETFYPNGPGPVGNAAQYNIWWYDASPINPNGTNVTANLLGSDADAKHFKAADNNTLAFGPANNARGFTIFSGSAFDITNAGVLDVSGVFGNGDYTFDCYRTHDFIAGQSGTITQQLITGWNLIPNPYPSNIDVSTLLGDGTNFKLAYKAVHVWNAKVQQYVAITDGVFINWNTSAGQITETNNIAPFQAFWVKADYLNPSSNAVADENITLTNAHRTVQDNANFFKNALPIVRINVESVMDGNKDQTVLAFSHDHNLGIENNDAYKLRSTNKNVPSIYTVVDGVPLCINRLPNPKTYYSIPMGFESRLLGEVYEFSVVKEEINPDWTIYLEDHKLGQLHNLAASKYRFQNVGEATNRFTIHINKYPENLSGSNLNKVAIYADENGINVAFNYMESEEAEVTISTLSGNLLFSGTISTAQNFTYPVNDQIALYVVHVNYRNGLTYAKVLR